MPQPTSSDPVGQSPTPPVIDRDLYKLPLAEVALRFAAEGLPRSNRTLQRYCEDQRLDCFKADTPVGKQYFVRESSVVRAIGELKQLEAMADFVGHSPTSTDVSGAEIQGRTAATDRVEPSQAAQMTDNVGQRPPSEHTEKHDDAVAAERKEVAAASSGNDFQNRYVERLERDIERLEREIDVKNGQIASQHELIASMAERDRETNVLIHSYNKYILPLLGGGKDKEDERAIG